MNSYILATYLVTSSKNDFTKKAQGIAVGLTVGSWTDLPIAKQERMQPHLGKVEKIEELTSTVVGMYQALITIAYPTINFTPDIPSLLTTIFGKLSMDGSIRLIDIQVPVEWAKHYPGPKFGIEGVRAALGVFDRPLLMSIFKSCIGLDVEELAEQFYQQALGQVDLIKDDEIFFADTHAPFLTRIQACRDAAERASDRTGQKLLYAVNLTGPVTEMVDKAKRAIEVGASCLLVNVLPLGYDILQRLAEDPNITVPIMAHPALAGAMYGSELYGIAAPVLLGTLMRMAGADLVLHPSAYGSVAMEKSETLKIAQQLHSDHPVFKRAFAVPSAGIHPGLVPLLYEDLGQDLIVNAGGGIHGHPQGAAAGGRAFRAGIEAVVQRKSLEESALENEALRIALDTWGKK